jgi:hypothetical protein
MESSRRTRTPRRRASFTIAPVEGPERTDSYERWSLAPAASAASRAGRGASCQRNVLCAGIVHPSTEHP